MWSDCIPSVNKPNPTHGYALRVIDGRRVYEHTAAWEAVNGPVPKGMVLDHICHNPDVCHEGKNCPHRRCINPDHLVPVTRGANIQRGWHYNSDKTHCPQNHEYTEVNTYVDPQGRRHCRTCTRAYIRRWRRRRAGALS